MNKIKTEIENAATSQLFAEDLETALSHYLENTSLA